MHIKGIHNIAVDVISRLDSGPIQDDKDNWMAFMKCWSYFTKHVEGVNSNIDHQEQINGVC